MSEEWLSYSDRRANGEMVCISCGTFSSARICWGCSMNMAKQIPDYKFYENLAELEHEQWAHWTRYMLNNLTEENISRWKKQIETPYNMLSEEEKESDRTWARKVIFLWNTRKEPKS